MLNVMSNIAHEDHLSEQIIQGKVEWKRSLVKSLLWEVKKKELKKEREQEEKQHSPEATLFATTDHSFTSDEVRGLYQRNKDIKNNLLKAMNYYY